MRVRLPSGFSTSSPRCRPSRRHGVYDATGREASAQVELEVGHQPLGHQRDQVGVARDPRRPARERLRRDRRAADPVEPLEDQHGEPGPGEVRRRDEAVVPGAHDRDVVPPEGGVGGRHDSNLVAVASPGADRDARNMQSSTTVGGGTDQPEEMGAMPAITVDDLTVLPRLREPGLGDQPRPVWQVTTAPSGYEGEGFPVRRAFAGIDLQHLDPFIMMDQMGEVEYAPGRAQGHALAPAPRLRDRHLHHRRRLRPPGQPRWRRHHHQRRHPVDDRRLRAAAHRGAAGVAGPAGRPVPRHPALGEPARATPR